MAKVLELGLEHQSFQFRTDFLRIDWFDLLAVQGTLKRLLEHHSSKASVFQHSAFFMVELSHPHMTTGKTIAETRPIFGGKVMSLLFNMLSRLVIVYLPRSKCLFISWLQSPSAVILEPKKIMYVNCTSIKTIFFNCGGGSHKVFSQDVWQLLTKPCQLNHTFHSAS